MKEEEVKKGFIYYTLFLILPAALCVSLMLISCGGGGSSNPVVPALSATKAKIISAGEFHTCAILSSNTVRCWGDNHYGQLGGGTTSDVTMMVDVTGLSNDVTAIAGGGDHTCALLSSGNMKCWGRNYDGELGDGTITNSTTPIDVLNLNDKVNAITTGSNHTCAFLSTGAVKCWGDNYLGQLGNGTTDGSPTPVDVTNLGSGVVAIDAGNGHTCALLSSGSVKCWGWDAWGQLGNRTSNSSPVDVSNLNGDVTAIAAGGKHTCALLAPGNVKCWGANYDGQLGNETPSGLEACNSLASCSITPIDVASLNSVKAIAAGENYNCALLSTGGVKCWGDNYWGQLGNGTTVNSYTPVDVTNMSSGVVAISAGTEHACALLSSGSVKCWGIVPYGQLSRLTASASENYSGRSCSKTPVDVAGL